MILIGTILLGIALLASVLMAAPVPTARTAPSGINEQDGQGTTITLSAAPSLIMWEQSITPMGFEGGDPIDMTNEFNQSWMIKLPRVLKELADGQAVVGYTGATLPLIWAQVNVNQTITITFRNGHTFAFYGWIKSFIPQERKKGEMPTANVTIVASNFDPVNNVEAGPVYT